MPKFIHLNSLLYFNLQSFQFCYFTISFHSLVVIESSLIISLYSNLHPLYPSHISLPSQLIVKLLTIDVSIITSFLLIHFHSTPEIHRNRFAILFAISYQHTLQFLPLYPSTNLQLES